MNKEILDIVEKVKSGKTIIYIGEDLIMMNMAKYHEYLNLEEEPVAKRILQAKCEDQEKILNVIIKKNVRIYWIKSYSCVESYNNGLPPKEQLTKEEFDLLKAYFE